VRRTKQIWFHCCLKSIKVFLCFLFLTSVMFWRQWLFVEYENLKNVLITFLFLIVLTVTLMEKMYWTYNVHFVFRYISCSIYFSLRLIFRKSHADMHTGLHGKSVLNRFDIKLKFSDSLIFLKICQYQNWWKLPENSRVVTCEETSMANPIWVNFLHIAKT
jgi:hypothetical protein